MFYFCRILHLNTKKLSQLHIFHHQCIFLLIQMNPTNRALTVEGLASLSSSETELYIHYGSFFPSCSTMQFP